MEDDAEKFLLAVRGGILGYILKDASARELASAIRMVANDEAVCPPGLCRALFDFVARQATGQAPNVRAPRLDESPQPVAPRHGGGARDRAPLGAVEDDAANAPGHLFDDDVGFDADQFAEKRTPLLGRHWLVAGPVDDGRRHARRVEQRFGLAVDVVLMDRAVHRRVPLDHHRSAARIQSRWYAVRHRCRRKRRVSSA